MPSNFHDVAAFHKKFELPTPLSVTPLTRELVLFRIKFMQEELDEFVEGFEEKNIAQQFDALIDLVYVAMGTAVLMGLPWQKGWDAVQRANMKKIRAQRTEDSLRGSIWDVVKPEGWEPPDIGGVLQDYQLSLFNLQGTETGCVPSSGHLEEIERAR